MLKVIDKSESVFNVFVTPNNQYVALRNKNLAFGNVSKEIYFVDNLSFAHHFYSHINELKASDYYHKFPNILDLIISNLQVKQIVSKTQYYFKEDI